MIAAALLFAAQLLALLIALVRQRGEDPRFQGAKLDYRS